MTLELRRVITGHDKDGKAVVRIDEISQNLRSGRPGNTGCVVWTTDTFPANIQGDEDEGLRPVGTGLKGGTVFRVVEYSPGVTPRNHRTDTIDYAVVIEGEIDMEMDDTTVHLKAGDVLVQRGTIHNWVNNSDKRCVIAFVLIDAEPYQHNGAPLPAVN